MKKSLIIIIFIIAIIILLVGLFIFLNISVSDSVSQTAVNKRIKEEMYTDGCTSAEVETWMTLRGRVYLVSGLEGEENQETTDDNLDIPCSPQLLSNFGNSIYNNSSKLITTCYGDSENFPNGFWVDNICSSIEKNIEERFMGEIIHILYD